MFCVTYNVYVFVLCSFTRYKFDFIFRKNLLNGSFTTSLVRYYFHMGETTSSKKWHLCACVCGGG